MIIYVEAAGCPNTCRHCAALGHPPQKTYYSIDELRRLSEEWGLLEIYHEPTAHPDFPAVYDPQIAEPHGGYLVTNGYGLARRDDYPSVLQGMQAIGIEYLAFTLHGLRDHHDWFACRKGAFDDILLAGRRARQAGFKLVWQVFLDRMNIDQVPLLVEMSLVESGETPLLQLPFHTVSQRLWIFERLRPSLKDIQNSSLTRLVDDPKKNILVEHSPESLTAQAWLQAWRSAPETVTLKHIFEPPTWPPTVEFEKLTLYFLGDHKVYLETRVTERILVGDLSEGKVAILDHLKNIQPPQYVDITPTDIQLSPEQADLLHPSAYSVRYLAISTKLRSH